MLDFTAISSYTRPDGLNCTFVKNPEECRDFSHLINQVVVVDATAFTILDIERLAHPAPWAEEETIGLLWDPKAKVKDPSTGQEIFQGTVHRCFETRFSHETQWKEALIAIPPNEEVYDGNLYYVKNEDGTFSAIYPILGKTAGEQSRPLYRTP